MSELKVVSFGIGEETYAIDIMKIDTVTEKLNLMKLPGMSPGIKGVANLREEVIPVMDTGKKFQVFSDEQDSKERIIVVYVKDKKLGLLVDDVKQVINIAAEDLEEPPKSGNMSHRFIQHIAKLDEGMLMVVDVENLLSKRELQEIGELSESVEV